MNISYARAWFSRAHFETEQTPYIVHNSENKHLRITRVHSFVGDCAVRKNVLPLKPRHLYFKLHHIHITS